MEVLKEDFLELEIGASRIHWIRKRSYFTAKLITCKELSPRNAGSYIGVKPLSQEMAAGALSINIGKRPRDFMNSKVVKHMHSVFAINDAISKKETREIDALLGITVTQGEWTAEAATNPFSWQGFTLNRDFDGSQVATTGNLVATLQLSLFWKW